MSEFTKDEWIVGPVNGEYRHRITANDGLKLIAETFVATDDEYAGLPEFCCLCSEVEICDHDLNKCPWKEESDELL